MGYRVRLSKVNKGFKDHFVGVKTVEEAQEILDKLYPEKSYNALYDPEPSTELHELGKYVNYKDSASGNYLPFYEFELDENDYVIVTKEGLASIIEDYRLKVLNSYKEMEKNVNELSGLADVVNDLRRKTVEWDNGFGFCSITASMENDNPIDVTRSWYYEYSIFNLIQIYKTFDWESDYLIYNGW